MSMTHQSFLSLGHRSGELDDAFCKHLAEHAAVREDDGSYRLR